MVITVLLCQLYPSFIYLLANNVMHIQNFYICVPEMTKAMSYRRLSYMAIFASYACGLKQTQFRIIRNTQEMYAQLIHLNEAKHQHDRNISVSSLLMFHRL